MEILKKGKLEREYVYFICKNEDCGTEFKVKKDDTCMIDKGGTCAYGYTCRCPDCGYKLNGMWRDEYIKVLNK